MIITEKQLTKLYQYLILSSLKDIQLHEETKDEMRNFANEIYSQQPDKLVDYSQLCNRNIGLGSETTGTYNPNSLSSHPVQGYTGYKCDNCKDTGRIDLSSMHPMSNIYGKHIADGKIDCDCQQKDDKQ